MLCCFQANFRKQQTSQLLPPLPIPPSPSPPLSLSLCIPFRGIASFCRPGWLHFHIFWKLHAWPSKHWPHQHFELLSFLAYPNNAWFITSSRVIKPKQLQVYGLAMPLPLLTFHSHTLTLFPIWRWLMWRTCSTAYFCEINKLIFKYIFLLMRESFFFVH